MPSLVVLVALVGIALLAFRLLSGPTHRPVPTGSALHEITDETGLGEVLASNQAVLYKHSTRCPVSAIVIDDVLQFAERHPGWPVHIIRVIEHRQLSNAVAEQLGVRHESPQALVLKNGRCLWHASHNGITARRLSQNLS